MDTEVRDRLLQLGATADEIEAADAEGRVPVLVVERMLFPGEARYRADDIAALAGVEYEFADRLWRAMGFPDSPPESREFVDADVAALKSAVDLVADLGDVDALVQQSRVVSLATARIAESLTDVLSTIAGELTADEEAALALLQRWDAERALGLYDYVLRRQIVAAVRRRFRWTGLGAETAPLTVGFVDLVGFTSLSLQIGAKDLSALVARFEALAFDTIATHGARLVKTIGDEVMFVSDDAGAAAEIALTLAETHADDDTLPDVRAGLARGEVTLFEGDYFGSVVNLASRVVSVARRGTIVVDDSVREPLRDDTRFRLVEIGTRRLKDVGPVRLWVLRRGDRSR
ncbi:MAG TPA: adenylate/guanylate cyclase domain-containing protein [Acidimicrobiia bacterium]|nr:adenylate/guanylate cyclase domain-containing protein [Acidimicrobiia bacterium]